MALHRLVARVLPLLFLVILTPVCTENLNPNIMMMKSAKDRA